MFFLPQSVTKECQADIKPDILSVTLCSIKLIEEVFELLEYFFFNACIRFEVIRFLHFL